MGRLHAHEQEAVDLVYYLWKADKAVPDDEFVVYIKDLNSQCDDGRATFTAEDLMVMAEKNIKPDFSTKKIPGASPQKIKRRSWR